ncbi:DUF2281 domain-containing protein [Thioflexithrix psekupsensis]|jgi:hypothetical protein|uniref:DUF2281 domain-containing protein n=1 Tax=Thioflexithrix psekupsensis TaxID=1570016 RepID=A0A251X570_9GAMM|nr:DUF2281 domain-containing protein [Thioflexithrix psekupsensis]OUD12087.1 hypothetical protein TPSD3_13225 [Thioflexithrix psekupsensis]
MSDLDLIAQIDKKIQQLPSNALPEVENYVCFLLEKYQRITSRTVRKSAEEITEADIDAVCGIYRAERSVTLEQMEAAIVQGAWRGCD